MLLTLLKRLFCRHTWKLHEYQERITAPSYMESDSFILELTSFEECEVCHSIRHVNVSKYFYLMENDLYERTN